MLRLIRKEKISNTTKLFAYFILKVCALLVKKGGIIMAFGVIYVITNLLNGMQYVGQTTRSVEQRFKEDLNFRAILLFGYPFSFSSNISSIK